MPTHLTGLTERAEEDSRLGDEVKETPSPDRRTLDSKPPPKSILSRLPSLQFRLTASTVALVLAAIWGMTLFALTTLRAKLEAVHMEQQFASVRYMAAELDHKLRIRLAGLAAAASRLDTRRLGDPAYLQDFLEQRYVSQPEFSAGTAIIAMDGRTIADFPVAPGRRGTYFGDRDYFRQAIHTRQPYIDRPVMGRALKRPVLTLSVPVIDAHGEVRAVMTGIVDLTAPDFLGLATDPQLLGRTEIYLVSLKDEIFVATTDKTRVMAAIAPPGQADIMDRLRAGFEGSVVSSNLQKIEKVYSAKRVPTTGWVVLQALPTEIAFEPVVILRSVLVGSALAGTLLALLVAGWLSRRLLQPLKEATEQLEAMSGTLAPVHTLPMAGDVEIRRLLTSFNRLTSHLHAQQVVLRHSEETFRSLFANMLNGFAYCHLLFDGERPVDFVYLSTNQAFKTQTGLVDVVGRKVSEVVPGIRDSDSELLELYGRVVRTGVPESAEIYVKALAQWRSVTVYRPQPEHFVAVFDIITERKRAEREQQRLNRTLRLLNDSNTVLLHAEREDAVMAEICELLLGKGGYLLAWVGVPQEDGEKSVRPVALSGSGKGYLAEIKASWADTPLGRGPTGTAVQTGKTRIVQDVLTDPTVLPWRMAAIERGYRSIIGLPLATNGNVLGVLTLYSAEPNAFSEEETELLENLADNLAFGIEGLRARSQLATTITELQGFTYAASHDLKAPLGRISNFSALLERNYRDRLEGDGLLFLDFIRQNAQRVTTLVDDLLAHAQVGKPYQRIQPIELLATVRIMLQELQGEIRNAGAVIRLGVPAVRVLAHPLGLKQVLHNLLENALKYSAQATPPVIEIGAEIQDSTCRLWVRDNGIGFDMAYHDRIFEIFRRLHTYGEIPGSGVGLALVKKAMEHMDGRVWAESAPGQGATFFIELRLADEVSLGQ